MSDKCREPTTSTIIDFNYATSTQVVRVHLNIKGNPSDVGFTSLSSEVLGVRDLYTSQSIKY